MKDPINCPFCEAEEKGQSSGWSGSPEFWSAMQHRHNETHCVKCQSCGQPINHTEQKWKLF